MQLSNTFEDISFNDIDDKNKNISIKSDEKRKLHGKEIYDFYGVQINGIKKNEDGVIRVSANVKSDRKKNPFRTSIVINDGKLTGAFCNCIDFESHICKHLTALVMEYNNPHEPNIYINDKNYLFRLEQLEHNRKVMGVQEEINKKTQNFSFDFEKMIHNDKRVYSYDLDKMYKENHQKKVISNQILKLEFAYQPIGKGIALYFKLGISNGKSIFITNLFDFVEAIENNKLYTLTKAKKINPKKEDFEDLEVLEYLINIVNNQKHINNLSNQITTSHHNIFLTGKILEYFFEKFDGYNIEDKETKKSYKISNTPKDICFELSYEEVNIPIDLEDNLASEVKEELNIVKIKSQYIALKKEINLKLKNMPNATQTIIANSKVYARFDDEICLIKTNKFNYELIANLLCSNIIIDKKDILYFLDYIAPQLNIDINLEDEILEKYQKGDSKKAYPLKPKMLMGLDKNNNIEIELIFKYGPFEFKALKVSDSKDLNKHLNKEYPKEIIRDKASEKEVIEELFLAGFSIENGFFVLKNEKSIYDFYKVVLFEFNKKYETLVTEEFKKRKLIRPSIGSVGIKLNGSMVDLDFSNLNFDISEIKAILESYRLKQKYYRLTNGDILDLDGENKEFEVLGEIAENFDLNPKKVKDNKVKLQKTRAMYLENLFNASNIQVKKSQEFLSFVNGFKNVKEEKLDEKYESILRQYQKDGVNWLRTLERYEFGGILADDMGLGKTLQIISFLSTTNEKAIIVCPSTLVFNWQDEFKKWKSDKKVLIVNGNPQQREEKIEKLKDYDVIITSYDLLKRDILLYEDIDFKYVIADEAQYLKNLKSKNAKTIKQLNGKSKFALTGTPIENSIAELWSIFDFIMPDYLYSYSKFRKMFESPIIEQKDKEKLEKLKKLISPFILRREKRQVLDELPEKTITVIKNPMLEEQEKIYNYYLAQIREIIEQKIQTNEIKSSQMDMMTYLLRLRQICIHPGMFLNDYKKGSGKIIQCMDLIKQALYDNHKVLLFSSLPSVFDILSPELAKENIPFFTLTRQTQISDRMDMVNRFNNTDEAKLFLISLKAGGTGLNLTAADVVIHFDPWWNLSAENQATDRAYRIGQKNNVSVYKLITENSIEERINHLQNKKQSLSDNILDTKQINISSLSTQEILELFGE